MTHQSKYLKATKLRNWHSNDFSLLRFYITLFLILTGVFSQSATAQIFILSGQVYNQNFNDIGSGAPDGWDVRTGSSASSLGTEATFPTGTSTWGDSAGAFKNLASSTAGASNTLTANQNAHTDRVLGIRQSGTFGDPGASFNFNFRSEGFSILSLSFDLEMLSVQGRSTSWSIQYATSASPSSFTTLGTWNDPGTFGVTNFSFNTDDFSTNLNDLDSAWFRVVALNGSSGSGSRDTIGINNFQMTFDSLAPEEDPINRFWLGNNTTRGGVGTWSTSGGSSWSAINADGESGGGWDDSKTAVFNIGAADVTVDGTVTVNNGITFAAGSDGSQITGGTAINLGGATASDNTITTGVGVTATIGTPLTGSAGMTKAGGGMLDLTGTIDLGGDVSVDEGSLKLSTGGTIGGFVLNGGTTEIASGATVLTNSSQLSSSSGSTLNVNGTLHSTVTSGWSAPTGAVVIGPTGTVIQQGNGSPTNFLFSGNTTWEEGSTFIFRDFTITPAVSSRTYAMNLVFDSSGSEINVGAISGGNPWTVQGDFTIGENVNFNYGTYGGNLDYQQSVIVAGTLGATNGARSFTINNGRELRLENSGNLNIAAGQTVTIEGEITHTATANQTAVISGGTLALGGGTRTVSVDAGTGNAALQIDSVIDNGGLNITGNGLLILTADNTFTGGINVDSGGLMIEGEHSGSGLVSVADGARIGGGGSIAGSLTLQEGASLVFNPGKTLHVDGTLTLDNAFSIASLVDEFGASIVWTAVADGVYTLISGGGSISNIENLGFDNRFSIDDGRFAFFESGSLELHVVPEPATYAAIVGLLALGLVIVRRRMRM